MKELTYHYTDWKKNYWSHSVAFFTTLSLSGSTLSNSLGSNSLANYLGKLRHPRLNPKQHVLNLLRRSMHRCSKQAKSRAYTALAIVRPHLETCVPVWSPYGKVQCDSLERVQKRAARWACQAKCVSGKCQWTKTYDDVGMSLDG